MSYSRRAFRQRRGNRDANHLAIRDGLRALGHHVIDLAGAGDGVPDLCVYPRTAWKRLSEHVEAIGDWPAPVWLELKVGKGKLRASQQAWQLAAMNSGIRVVCVRSLDEALTAVTGDTRPAAELAWDALMNEPRRVR